MKVAMKLQNHKLVSDKKFNSGWWCCEGNQTLLITLAHLNLYRYWDTSLMWVLQKSGNFGPYQKTNLWYNRCLKVLPTTTLQPISEGWEQPIESLLNDLALKVCGCYSVRFSCSPTSTNYIYTHRKLCCISKSTMKHQQKPNQKSDFPQFSYR